jgi:hypothetical protein
VHVGPIDAAHDKHVDVVRRWAGCAVVAGGPRSVDQDAVGAGEVELLPDDGSWSEGALQQLGQGGCRLVGEIGAQEPGPADRAVLEDAGLDQALRLALQRGQRDAEALGEVGEGVLVLGVQEQPGKHRCLVLGPEGRQKRRGSTTHRWQISPI